jgi:hypothetical protein
VKLVSVIVTGKRNRNGLLGPVGSIFVSHPTLMLTGLLLKSSTNGNKSAGVGSLRTLAFQL